MALKRRSKGAADELFPGFTDIVEIGVGSLSTVYRARELGTDRYVALKLLNVRDAAPRALESFERESVALGAVSSHPNIVTLYRTFRAGDGRPVLVLELCAGSMARRTQDGSGLRPADVVALGIKVAGALETAHRAQILHRDVKPQNILVTAFGEPALADFGVALLQSSTQTTAGLFDVTTLHAAPELLEGRGTSPATDVYELASTLYQLASGRAAFRAYEGESPASVILRILRDPVQPIGGATVPSRLSDLLVIAMSKDKAQRPATAAEFAAELAGIEVDQGWPRTQFLVRDPGSPRGGFAGPPAVRRIPDPPPVSGVVAAAVRPDAPQPQQPAPPAVPPASQQPPTVTVPRYPAPPPSSRPHVLPTGTVPVAEGVAARTTWSPPPVEAGPVEAGPVAEGSSPPTLSRHAAEPEPEPARPEADAPPSAPRRQVVLEHRVVERVVLDLPPAPVPPPDAAGPDPAAALRRIWGAVPELPPPPARAGVPSGTASSAAPSDAEARDVHPVVPWREVVADYGPAVPAPAVTDTDPERTPERQYPVAPTFSAGDQRSTPVPTWAFRAAPAPPQPRFGDPRLDPGSLSPRVTIRAGAARLVVDEQRLRLRSWLSRTELPWADVLAIEPRYDSDASGSRGRLVAVTHGGPVELPATRRPPGDLRYMHALLDAYRERAAMTGPR